MICAGGGSSSGSSGSEATGDEKVLNMAKSIKERLPTVFDTRKAHSATFEIQNGNCQNFSVNYIFDVDYV